MLEIFHKLPVSHDLDDGKIRSRDVVVDNQVKFSTLLLEPQIHDGLAKCGYIYLSPIQQHALPLALTGSSIIAHAKSGTGKTLIYVLPILNDFVKRKPNSLQCLVLAPTREIAKQIYDVFRNVACYVEGLQVEYFIGGTPVDMDVLKCKNCHLAIGAPGRIKHLIDLGYLKTTNLQLLVLDEVDALFDHKEYAVEDIISLLPSPNQLIVCTATFTSKVGDLVKSVVPNIKYASADKLEIEDIGHISNVLIAIKQYVAPVKKDSSSMDAMRKREKLVEILQNFNFEQCFIFVNYMTLVRSTYNHLISQNFSASWLCSDQNQSTRINTINKLKMNHCKILVTTDLAARGIDVHKVNLVISLGLPCPPEIYIHRMGRAGRYGSKGAVITILSEGEEVTTFTKMISVICTDPIDLHVLPEKIDSSLSNLEIIPCLPTEGSISEDEFTFKCQMKDNQEKTAERMQSNTKTKKKKRKNAISMKLALQNGITDKPSFINKDFVEHEMANHEDDRPVSSEIINGRIEQFSQLLASHLVVGKQKLEWDSLKLLFGLKDDNTTIDESFAFIQNPPADLLTYALYVKQKNEFVDEQIMPCTVDEFLSLLNCNQVFGRHSFGLSSLIKEISGKIYRPVKQQLNAGQTVSSEKSSFDSEQSESSSQVSGFSVTNLSQQLLETIVKDCDERNISERVVKKNNACSWSKKCSGNFHLAEEFLNAMLNYGEEKYSSSQKQSANIGTSKKLSQSRNYFSKGRFFPTVAVKSTEHTSNEYETISPRPFFNNYRRLNSATENEKYPITTVCENRQSKLCDKSELSDQFLNDFQNSAAINICSKDTLEGHNVSPNQLSGNSNLSNVHSEDEEQLHNNTNEKRARANQVYPTPRLSDQFSHAIKSSTNGNGPRNSSEGPWTPSNNFSRNRNHSNSILINDQLHQVMNETNNRPKQISKNFSLPDQILKTANSSTTRADLENPFGGRKTSPKLSSSNFNSLDLLLNGTKFQDKASEEQVLSRYSSSNPSLSDQFFNSVNDSKYDRCETTFDHEQQKKSYGRKNIYNAGCKNESKASSKRFENSYSEEGLVRNKLRKKNVNSFKTVPEFGDVNNFQNVAKLETTAEYKSKSRTKDLILSKQLLDAFERSHESIKTGEEPPEITSNVNFSEQCSAAVNHVSDNIIPATFQNVGEISSLSHNLVAEVNCNSNFTPVPEKNTKSTPQLTSNDNFKIKSSSKSILIPETKSESNCVATVVPTINNISNSISEMKNSISMSFSDNEACEEPSPLISNFVQLNVDTDVPSEIKSNRVNFMSNFSKCVSEHLKNAVKTYTTNKPKYRHVQTFSPNCGIEDETGNGNVINTVFENSMSSFKNVRQSENTKSSSNTVPVSVQASSVASDCKALDLDSINHHKKTDRLNLPHGNQVAVTLPSLQSYVSSQQEQNIWQHHFAFIRRHAASRGRVITNQRH